MDPTKKPAAEPPGEADDSAQDDLDTRIARALDTRLNAAITGHMKRAQGAWEKALDDKLAKLAPAAPPPAQPADKPAQGADKADPETLRLREKLEALEKKHAEAEAKARAVEERARKDATRTSLREALEAKGIKGARARAVIADFEQSGALRFDEETGEAQLVVKRVRAKGAKAEEYAFDLAGGVEDWLKTADAAEFLPAAAPGAPTSRQPGGAPPVPRAPAGGGSRPLTDDERAEAAARQLEAAGIDAAGLFD